MLTKPLVLQHPCHNQAVERHVKLVTEAASVVTGPLGDGPIDSWGSILTTFD